MLSLNKNLQTGKSNFIKSLQEDKAIEKITKKLDAFYKLEYDDFKKELRKQKVKIALGAENNEWREYFAQTKEKITAIQNQINQTDNEIDQMVYKLYELTDEEIRIVEESVK
jgi:seryl-tRNA synthetase